MTQVGARIRLPIANVFLFIGADPATRWLAGCGVALDGHGFKRVGSAIGEGAQVVPALHSFLNAEAHA